ncbi:MAG TPA: Crp/Fnr family transcriptional regulator, partial [Cytophagales bacterium]
MSNSLATDPFLQPGDPNGRTTRTLPVLTGEQVGRAKAFGSSELLPQGHVLFDRGDRNVDFFIVLEGTIEIYEYTALGPTVFVVLRENQFTGELNLFNDRAILVGGRMGADGQVLRVDRKGFRRLLAAEPDIGEVILRAFMLRRAGFVSHRHAAVTLITAGPSADALRLERFLEQNGYPFGLMHVDQEGTQELLAGLSVAPDELPVVVCHHQDTLLRKPSN